MSELRAVGGPRRIYPTCILYAAGRCWPPLLALTFAGTRPRERSAGQKHSLRRVSNCRWPALLHQASWAQRYPSGSIHRCWSQSSPCIGPRKPGTSPCRTCVLHLDRALVVVPIVVLLVLLVPAAGVAVAAALHARIALHVPDAGLQVALVVVGHGPTRALVAPAHTAQPLASISVGVADRAPH